MIVLIATLQIKPGSLPEIRKHVMPCIEGTRNEPGNILYDLHQSLTDENKLVFVEKWQDRAALQSHFTAPHFLEWREKGAPYFLSRTIEIMEVDDIEVM